MANNHINSYIQDIMHYVIALLLFCHALTAEHSLGVMKFDPPQGWRFADLKSYPKSVKVVVVGQVKSTFPPQLNLNAEPFSGTLQEYLKIVKDYNLSQRTEWKDLGTIRTECGEGSLSQVDVMTEWGVLRMMHVILIKDNVAYILNASALKEEFAAYYPDFFKSMRSLRYSVCEK
jgi:hypothetical protein